MVGIVLVSHSRKIAEGALELISQMISEDTNIGIAAGTWDNRLGTDAELIEQRIREVERGQGVLILVDLGSAIMSAEVAIENLEEPLRSTVSIVDAPFVEGAVVAAMEASFGKSLEEVKVATENTRGMRKIA